MVAVAWVGMALVGVVYALAVSNLLLLLSVQVEARTQEFLLRLALGAGPSRIVRIVSADALSQVVVGSCLGVLGSMLTLPWVYPLFVAEAGGVVPHVDFTVDWRVAVYSAAVVASTVLVFTRVLAARVVALDGREMELGHARVSPAWRHLRRRTLSTQLACATALVSIAVVFARASHSAVERAEAGLAANVAVGWHSVESGATLDSIRVSLGSLPAVDQLALASSLPASGPRTRVSTLAGRQSRARCMGVDQKALSVLGIRLTAGRSLRGDDYGQGAVISEALARTLWSDGGAVGREITVSDCPTAGVVRIVGVTADAAAAVDPGAGRTVYVTLQIAGLKTVAVFLRGSLPPEALAHEVKTALSTAGKTGSLFDVSPLASRIAGIQGPQEGGYLLIHCLAALAVLMAAIGIVGLALQATADARRELAIRRTLGATRLSTVGTIVRGLWSVELGNAAVLGIVAALIVCSFLQSSVRYLPAFDWISGVIVAAGGLLLVLAAASVPVLVRVGRREHSLIKDLA